MQGIPDKKTSEKHFLLLSRIFVYLSGDFHKVSQ